VRIELIDVTPASRQAFLDYVAEHGAEHDDTFTRPDDLPRRFGRWGGIRHA
jgi:hypothetical protein